MDHKGETELARHGNLPDEVALLRDLGVSVVVVVKTHLAYRDDLGVTAAFLQLLLRPPGADILRVRASREPDVVMGSGVRGHPGKLRQLAADVQHMGHSGCHGVPVGVLKAFMLLAEIKIGNMTV